MNHQIYEDINDLIKEIKNEGLKNENIKKEVQEIEEKLHIDFSKIIKILVNIQLNKKKEALENIVKLFNNKNIKENEEGKNILNTILKKFANKFKSIDMIKEEDEFEIITTEEIEILLQNFQNSIIKIKLTKKFVENNHLIPKEINNNEFIIKTEYKQQNINNFLEMIDKYTNQEISKQNIELFDVNKIINGIFQNDIEIQLIKNNPQKFITIIEIINENNIEITIPHKTLKTIVQNIEDININIKEFIDTLLKKGMIDNPPKEYSVFYKLYEKLNYILEENEKNLKKNTEIKRLIENIKRYDKQNEDFILTIYNLFMFGTNIPKRKVKDLFIKIKKLI